MLFIEAYLDTVERVFLSQFDVLAVVKSIVSSELPASTTKVFEIQKISDLLSLYTAETYILDFHYPL